MVRWRLLDFTRGSQLGDGLKVPAASTSAWMLTRDGASRIKKSGIEMLD